LSKAKIKAIADAFDEVFAIQEEEEDTEDPWRESPLPLDEFVRSPLHLSSGQRISLFPQQLEDLQAFLGASADDAKALFSQEPPTDFNCAVLAYGKSCLGAGERLLDYSTGETRSISKWAAIGRSLLLESWDERTGRKCLKWSSPPFLKGRDRLYRVTLVDGLNQWSFVATAKHRCFSLLGDWLKVEDFEVGDTWLLMSDRFAAVSAIEPLPEGDFYDLTVSETHCYFDAQGILHHNSGKGYMVSICLAWFVYVLLCLKDPQSFLGLAPAEPIDLALCSPTLRQTRRITFQKFKNRLYSWEWFRSRLESEGIDPDRFLKNRIGADFIEFPRGIRLHNLPLDSTAAEGFNMLAFCVDEMAGMTSEATGETASSLLNTFITSARSRFKKAWKGWVIGFPRSVNDPQEQIIAEAEAGKFPGLLVRRRATWEVNTNLTELDFSEDFLRNPEDSEAKFRAVPMAASQSFFRSPDLIVKNASGGDRTLLTKHYPDATPGQIEALAVYMPDPILERDELGDMVLNKYGFPHLAPWFRGQCDREGMPIEIYIHIDVGLSRDSTGLAIGWLHKSGDKVQPVLGLTTRWKASHFAKFGKIKRWNWGEGAPFEEFIEAAEIDLQTIADFVIWLKRARGFEIAGLTCDGFNSAQLMQRVRIHDVPVELHIANKADYDELKGQIYARTLRYRCDRILYYELIKLVTINSTKVEAPRTKLGTGEKADSHKDLADAAAVVVGRLCRMLDESIEYIEVEQPQDIWERANKESGGVVKLESENWDAAQQQILQTFFDE
jgi:hypothetical protein